MTLPCFAAMLLAVTPELGGLARATHSSGVLELRGLEPIPLRLSGLRLRGLLDVSEGAWTLSAHAVQEVVGQTAGFGAGGDGFIFGEANRTTLLRWVQAEGRTYRLAAAVDRLHLRFDEGDWTVELGRFPVSLATNRLFVPNDAFQPFAAQTFFRLYKPGVDAASVRWSPGPLTRVELIGVLGYERGVVPATDDAPSVEESALLLRAGTAVLDLDWTLFGGWLAGDPVVALGVQGELFAWLEVGLEGHLRFPENEAVVFRGSFAVGRQLTEDISIRVEHLIQTDGADTPLARAAALSQPTGQGLIGPHLTGGSLFFQAHPLVAVGAVVLRDWSGDAWLVAANTVVSLLDEAELALSASLPLGPGLEGGLPSSELGLAPRTITGEFRVYF